MPAWAYTRGTKPAIAFMETKRHLFHMPGNAVCRLQSTNRLVARDLPWIPLGEVTALPLKPPDCWGLGISSLPQNPTPFCLRTLSLDIFSGSVSGRRKEAWCGVWGVGEVDITRAVLVYQMQSQPTLGNVAWHSVFYVLSMFLCCYNNTCA